MKSPAQKLHETIKAKVAHYAVEFDMTVYEVLGVLFLVLQEMWYEHDQPDEFDEEDEDE
jgi:hypothetical protein